MGSTFTEMDKLVGGACLEGEISRGTILSLLCLLDV